MKGSTNESLERTTREEDSGLKPEETKAPLGVTTSIKSNDQQQQQVSKC